MLDRYIVQGHTLQTYIEHRLCTGKIDRLLAVVASSLFSSTDPYQVVSGTRADASAGWGVPEQCDRSDAHQRRSLRSPIMQVCALTG